MDNISDLSRISDDSIQSVAQIRNSLTGYDIFKALKLFMPSFGLDRFAVFVAPADGLTDLDDRVVLTNWESELIQRAMESDFYHWSFVTNLRASVLPTSVSLRDKLAKGEDTNNRELAEFLLARGYDTVVHLPTRSSNGKTGAVSFSGPRSLVEDSEVIHLSFVAEHAFERLMHIIDDADTRENPLSDREIECLKAAARGMNVAETGRNIGITSHTVNYHLSNAQRKIGARNKLHAVVNAIQQGWLGPF